MSVNICCRVTASFTGRPTWRAHIAARTTCGRGVPFDPNPPPTCGETTCTRSSSIAKTFAIARTTFQAPWLESYSVSPSPSQTATVACGSIGLLCSVGVE